MKQVLLKKGTIYTADVARPQVEKGMVLVKTAFSCISAGTELSGVESSGDSLMKTAMKHPEYIQMGIEMLRERGIRETYDTIQGKYNLGTPMGYSASGVVVESGTTHFRTGDRIACMGVGYANHAGFITAPENLTVKVPEGVSMEHASTAALGCIAMQGIRRADVKLGEYVVITGAGILGQLACRFARASGATVIITDLDKRRLEIARKSGADYALNADEDIISAVNGITGGHGADSVVVTAATRSDELLSQAFKMCRKKGRVVLVGVAGMHLKREDMYQKELDFVISTSYGPGRYDSAYEEKGVDYPYGYVRFTEKRNLESYLRLMEKGQIDISDMVENIYPAEQANDAYEALKRQENRPLIVLLKYEEDEPGVTVIENKAYVPSTGRIRVAICGAGGFAKGMHIPNLKKLKDRYEIYAVQSRTGANAQAIAVANHAKYATTDYGKILSDPDVDMVMICTRHNLHAKMVIQAMNAGKAVFVEKPMGLTNEEIDEVIDTARKTGVPFMVGYNRRFSKYAVEIKNAIQNRSNPLIISYRMNAGYIPMDHWTQTDEGGGRIIGEACHILDLFDYFTECRAQSISVDKLSPTTDKYASSDNVVITVRYEDGSICTLLYTAMGNKDYKKEFCEVYCEGNVYIINDYQELLSYGSKLPVMKSATPEKGQYDELIVFHQQICDGTRYPISLDELEMAGRMSITVENQQ